MRRNLLQIAIAIAVAVSLSACLHIQTTRESFMSEGAPKAAFDLQCDKDKLEISELGGNAVGVRGCGKQARYERVQTSDYAYSWVNNTGVN